MARNAKAGCEVDNRLHIPLTDEDGDVVCTACHLVIEVGPLGINGVTPSGFMYGKLVATYRREDAEPPREDAYVFVEEASSMDEVRA